MDLTQYRSKLIGSEDERAVSPVIGVILMVAITVILAAVIAAFVLDLGQSQSASASAGVQYDEDGSDLTVTFVQDDRTDGTGLEVYCDGDTSGSSDGTLSSVGSSVDCSSGDEPVVIGTYQGEETVVSSYNG